jgi:hypothetical protein
VPAGPTSPLTIAVAAWALPVYGNEPRPDSAIVTDLGDTTSVVLPLAV